jgi:hypothetical protein
VHNGFNSTDYAYCDSCGGIAFFSIYSRLPGLKSGDKWPDDWLRWAKPCRCGGQYSRSASPRCPHCCQQLSAEAASEYLERNAPGYSGGWRWQRSWSGLYSIIINDNAVDDPWSFAG